jgi:hypothetical protein
LYHTILDAAGHLPDIANLDPNKIHGLSLFHTINGRDPEQQTAYSEIYPPLNFVRAIENHQPELLEPYRCHAVRRAVVQREETEQITHKLIAVNDEPDELFALPSDPCELDNLLPKQPLLGANLFQNITRMARSSEQKRAHLRQGKSVDLEDERLLQQLRGLGYID